ncbi:HNH endonuclease [Arthrobacter globiformis]|uniref:Restriction endonuclease n=1 Tax=Arthrobacter globiformis TaxID=1665 RepID=A0A328HE59_ARTGO|nr:HNH endonuclease [Arthrobacter globiformis]RAM35600.1 restriction endonuclease [Arthrobacter globiformis]
MVAVLLGWNPGVGDTWPGYSRVVDELGASGVHRRVWPVVIGAEPAPGADAWLFLHGKTGSGLIGHGVVASAPYPAGAATSVDVDFDVLLPLGDQIPVDTLADRAPLTDWSAAATDACQPVPEEQARAIRELWAECRPADEIDPVLPVPGTLPQDALARVCVNRYERNPHARRICLAHYGTSCAVCGFSFEAAYGPEGEGFIHVHHLVPAVQLGPGYELDPVGDLVPLCPNCHAMAHRRRIPYTVAELRAMRSRAGYISGSVVSQQEQDAQADARRILGST